MNDYEFTIHKLLTVLVLLLFGLIAISLIRIVIAKIAGKGKKREPDSI